MCAISVVSFNAVSIPVREPRCRNIVNVGPNEQHGVDVAVQRLALQLPPRRAASERAKIPMISRAEGGLLHARVGWPFKRALVLCSIRKRYTADPELCNNATPYRRAKTTTYSGSLVIGPRHGGIIMQQSLQEHRAVGLP